ncbi:hypothetical protein EGT07_25600 [Herbaspirillum sp. HC18]|nr:hypothetical protein EGT07_25600 [Herbaspirillum sp. HC18]
MIDIGMQQRSHKTPSVLFVQSEISWRTTSMSYRKHVSISTRGSVGQEDVDMLAERLANAEERAAKLDQKRTVLMEKLAEHEAHIAELSRAKVER